MIAAERLLEATSRFIEADLRQHKARATRSLERALEPRLARIFRRQGAAFLRQLAGLRSRFTRGVTILPRGTLLEAIAEEDWLPLFTAAEIASVIALEGTLRDFAGRALLAGGAVTIAELDVDASFDLSHPEAVGYLDKHVAARVAGINAATRDVVGAIITAGAEAGTSYSSIARELRTAYDGFARSRAQIIAITELGDAYEAGSRTVVDGLTTLGLEIEKQWLDVGDRRVDPVCASNAAEGWIPLEAAFGSGHQHPTAHPGCRCTTEYRRRGSSFV